MKAKKKILFPLMLLPIIFLCYLFPCSFFGSMLENSTDRYANGTEGRMGGDIYSINSRTILKAIENGEINAFTLQTETPEEELASSVQWSQADFIKVLTAFKRASLSPTEIDQKISSMEFTVDDCRNDNLGLQSAHFFTYRLKSGIFVWPPFQMVSYSYSINPLYNEVSWNAEWYDQYAMDILQHGAVLDLTKINISAEEALRIAELNGGKDARSSMLDQCAIVIEINANSNNGNWVVTYGSLLSIEIDKTDGNHIVRASGQGGIYGFDSQTILDSLKSGNKDVFTQLSPLHTEKPVSPQPVNWTQDDYYLVADAFVEMLWKERLKEWELSSLYFETSCDYASLGPQQISFSVFRQSIPDKYYYKTQIEIKPRQNMLTWVRHEDYNPRYALFSIREKNGFNWSQIKIPANQALQIVEEQGGKSVSLKLKQSCGIFGSLIRNEYIGQHPQWQINYEWIPSQSSGLIMAFVDIETGAHRIFNYYENKP